MINIFALPKSIGPVSIYSLCILTGALAALGLSCWRLKQRGYNPSDLELVFIIAFPMGLIGSRIWYCAWQWYEFWPSGTSFWEGLAHCFGFVNGRFVGLAGLAIQGGALFGIVSGMIVVKKRRKHMKLLDVTDCAVPTILVAQAIGRWGNFFNQEVYGKVADPAGWSWLGSWFTNQMTIDGSFRTPLFLIEGIINVCGFLIIVLVLDRALRKYMLPGVVASCYFVWYGTVRMIMEPLRDPKFIMSPSASGFSTSKFIAILFIVFGVLIIAWNYINHYVLKPRHKDFQTGLLAYAPWFNSLNRETRLVLTAIPVTAWINAVIYRLSKDNFSAGLLAIFFGPVYWIIDLVFMIKDDKMGYWSDGQKATFKDSPDEIKELK